MASYGENVTREISGIPGETFGASFGSSPQLKERVYIGDLVLRGCDNEAEVERKDDGSVEMLVQSIEGPERDLTISSNR